MATEGEKLHIVFFPWLAVGHLNGFFELAKLIAHKGHTITFISTPKNILRLPKIPPPLAPHFNLLELPLPKVENLPEGAENTTDVPDHLQPYLKKACDLLEEPLANFLETSDADWIVHDFNSYWLGPMGKKLGVKTSFFATFNAASMAFFGPPAEMTGVNSTRKSFQEFFVPPPWIPFPTTVAFRMQDVNRIMEGHKANDSGVSDGFRSGKSIEDCDVFTVRSCYEFEGEYLKVLEELYRKPVIPVGELAKTVEEEDGEDDTWRGIKEWLEKQEKGKVVYIAFGTEAKLSQKQVTEIALGLEKSELPFFWVLRTHTGFADSECLTLPEGFEERTKERGMVWSSWAPQPKILAHESVGGFWTHGGLNSIVEGIQNGKPLLVLSFQLDQGLNARLLEDKKVGYSIRREDDGSFTSEDVTTSLKLVMVEEEGKVYREKVKEVKDAFANRELQDGYVNKLLGYFLEHRNPKHVA
ncbi:UDP-glycosyltransferase 91A1-like [Senna tora]|uniref:UDP-glycosyltransferase 91A1-like n=1 Tax=Senna tora TaxID=362788 RepID=A0A835CJ73_9FABA|nr:UDP-glycosyltransferase 91A1-like [Senna tora]